jgi:thioredoxin 1
MKEVSDITFDSEINSPCPIVLDFWAEWCNPCKSLLPMMNDLNKTYGDKVKFLKINVDECPDLSIKYNIKNLPTVLFLKERRVIDKFVGVLPKNTIESKIKNNFII